MLADGIGADATCAGTPARPAGSSRTISMAVCADYKVGEVLGGVNPGNEAERSPPGTDSRRGLDIRSLTAALAQSILLD
jgi:hypothetical protein